MTARLEMKSSESEAPLIGDRVKATKTDGKKLFIRHLTKLTWSFAEVLTDQSCDQLQYGNWSLD